MTFPDISERTAVIELFSGAGGFTWGWRRAGFQTIAAIDIDAPATRTHDLNFGAETISLNRDLNTFGPSDLHELLGTRPQNLLAVTGGPPCQGWSKVGRGKMRSLEYRAASLLHDPRNELYRNFLEYINHFRPPVCVMENVPGMMSIEGQNIAEAIRLHHAEVGYECSYAVVNARWFGVPQDRKRLIFLSVRRDLRVRLDATQLEAFAASFRSRVIGVQEDTTVRQAIADLPEIEPGAAEDPRIYRHPTGRRSRYAELMREGCGSMVPDHICRWHNDQDIEAFRIMRQGSQYHELPKHLKRYRDDIFKDKYKRLYWDRPAWTVTAHFQKDVYTHIHPEQHRTVSVREAARLQSFPDSFRFFGNIGERFRQIGNAVPPFMSWGIAEFVRQQCLARSSSRASGKRSGASSDARTSSREAIAVG